MSTRELVVLGTASQIPTRARNHNGYVLRWDDQLVLVDPGEGTQRQAMHTNVTLARLTAICITHFHGDHCLGLPGVLQRLALDGVEREIPLFFPADGAHFIDRLRQASVCDPGPPLRLVPVPLDRGGPVGRIGNLTVVAHPLDHRASCVGYRFEEDSGVTLDPDLLALQGLHGPTVGRLVDEGAVEVGGRRVALGEVSHPKRGQVAAFVLDTRMCDGALALAAGADLLVCEATYLDEHRALADDYGHLTARQAAWMAREVGVRTLVLTHLSQRYPTDDRHRAEVAPVFPGAIVAADLDVVPVPPRDG